MSADPTGGRQLGAVTRQIPVSVAGQFAIVASDDSSTKTRLITVGTLCLILFRQHVVFGVASLEVLGLLLTTERLGKLVHALANVAGQILSRDLPDSSGLGSAFEALDDRIGEKTVTQLGVLQCLLV